MTEPLVETIWDAVSERVGDELRGVTRYNGLDFEMKLRADVRASYSNAEDRELVDEAVLSQLNLGGTEDAFKTGDLQSVIHIFEEAWVLQWPDNLTTKSGILISIQRDGTAASMADIEWCIDYLSEDVSPQIEDAQ